MPKAPPMGVPNGVTPAMATLVIETANVPTISLFAFKVTLLVARKFDIPGGSCEARRFK